MLKMRVIPCLDVKDGRVVKGVNFVDLVDAGDPVEQARLYDREGADELCFLDITASHEGRDTLFDVVAPHRRAMLHAADRRRRRAHGRGHPQAAAGRRRQGLDQHRRGGAPGIRARGGARNSAASASSSRSTPRRSRPASGASSPMAAARPTGLDAVDWACRHGRVRRRRDPADLDGPRRHQGRLRHRADPRRGRRGAGAGDRLGRRRHARPSGRRASATATRRRCSPPRSSISAPIRIGEAKAHLAAAGVPVRL